MTKRRRGRQPDSMRAPTHGWTKRANLPVHGRVHDHMPDHSAYARFNKRVALFITKKVMTMTFFWMANVLSFCSLPAILHQFSAFRNVFPHWLVTASLIALIAWLSSNWLQLIFLPAIGVGQVLQGAAGDARAAKTFEDVAAVLDLLDLHTEGGLKIIHDDLVALEAKLPAKRPPRATPAAKP